MKFEPPLDSVVVERELVFEDRGIKLPEPMAQWFGKIIAVGPGMLRTLPLPGLDLASDSKVDIDRYPMQYSIGDLVICPPGMQPFPEEVPIDRNANTRLFVCSERQLIAKIIFEPGDKMNGNGKA